MTPEDVAKSAEEFELFQRLELEFPEVPTDELVDRAEFAVWGPSGCGFCGRCKRRRS